MIGNAYKLNILPTSDKKEKENLGDFKTVCTNFQSGFSRTHICNQWLRCDSKMIDHQNDQRAKEMLILCLKRMKPEKDKWAKFCEITSPHQLQIRGICLRFRQMKCSRMDLNNSSGEYDQLRKNYRERLKKAPAECEKDQKIISTASLLCVLE